MFVCNVANLPEHAVLVFVSIAAFHFMWVVALLLLPLLVTFVVDHFVSIFVGVEFMMLMVLVVLLVFNRIGSWLGSIHEIRYHWVVLLKLASACAYATSTNKALMASSNVTRLNFWFIFCLLPAIWTLRFSFV